MVEVVAEEILGRHVGRQEPAPPEVTSEVQNVQCGTLGDEVWTELPQNFINLDSDNEEHPEAYRRTLNPENGSKEVEEPGGKIPRRDGFPR